MVRAGDVQDDVVRGQIDLDHDVLRGHLVQQTERIVFVEHVNAMTDALRVAEVDGLANMKAEACRAAPCPAQAHRRAA